MILRKRFLHPFVVLPRLRLLTSCSADIDRLQQVGAERDCCARPIEFKVAVNRSESATTAAAVLLCGLGAAPCVENPSKFDYLENESVLKGLNGKGDTCATIP